MTTRGGGDTDSDSDSDSESASESERNRDIAPFMHRGLESALLLSKRASTLFEGLAALNRL